MKSNGVKIKASRAHNPMEVCEALKMELVSVVLITSLALHSALIYTESLSSKDVVNLQKKSAYIYVYNII